jgi:hypothetical protein
MQKAISLFGIFCLVVWSPTHASIERASSEESLGSSLMEIPVRKQGPPDFDREIRELAASEKRFQGKSQHERLDPLRPILDRLSHDKIIYRRHKRPIVSKIKKRKTRK